jgi:hypothetical protein
MIIEFRSSRSLSVALILGAMFAVGCSSAGTKGQGNTGGSEEEETGGKGGSTATGGKSGTGGKAGGTGGAMATGGSTGTGGSDATGGSTGTGGSKGTGGSTGNDAGADAPVAGSGGPDGGGSSSDSGELSTLNCNSPGLVWKTARKTWYTSYPVPGSEECIKYNGCFWQGKFNTCGDTLVKSKAWVMSHNIVALFPLGKLGLHNLCLKSGTKTIEVTAYDTCGDSDCNGCCTQNKGSADALIDLESFTNQKWGVADGQIQWADLGFKGASCTDAP